MKTVGQTDTTNYTLISLISTAGVLGALGGEMAFKNWPPVKSFVWAAPALVWGIIVFALSYNEHRFRRRDVIVPAIFATSDTVIMIILLASTNYYFNIPNLLTVISLGIGVYCFIRMCKSIHPFFHIGENLVYSDGSVLRQNDGNEETSEETGKRVVVRDFLKFKKEVLKTIPIEPPSGKGIPFSAPEAPPEPGVIGVEMETGFSSPEEMWAQMESITKGEEPAGDMKPASGDFSQAEMDENERKVRSEVLWGSLKVTAVESGGEKTGEPASGGEFYFTEDFRSSGDFDGDESSDEKSENFADEYEGRFGGIPDEDRRFSAEAEIMSESSDMIAENSPIAEILEASGIDISGLIGEKHPAEALPEPLIHKPDVTLDVEISEPDTDDTSLKIPSSDELPLEKPSNRKKPLASRKQFPERTDYIPLDIIEDEASEEDSDAGISPAADHFAFSLSGEENPEEESPLNAGGSGFNGVDEADRKDLPIVNPIAEKRRTALSEDLDRIKKERVPVAEPPVIANYQMPVVINKMKPISARDIFKGGHEKKSVPFVLRNPENIKTDGFSGFNGNEGPSGVFPMTGGVSGGFPVMKTLEGLGRMKPVKSSELWKGRNSMDPLAKLQESPADMKTDDIKSTQPE